MDLVMIIMVLILHNLYALFFSLSLSLSLSLSVYLWLQIPFSFDRWVSYENKTSF